MLRKKTKVFIGLCDIASFIEDWDIGFKANGFDTIKVSMLNQSPFQTSKLDVVIQKSLDKVGYFRPGRISVKLKPLWDKWVLNYYFKKLANECDIFVFFWNTFYPDHSDLKILKEKGKKIIIVFVGDEIRWQPAMKQEFLSFQMAPIEYDDYDYSNAALYRGLQFLRTGEKYADLILSAPNACQLSLRPYNKVLIPIIAEHFKEISQQRKRPIIVHAPSSSSFKGTKYVLEVIQKLKTGDLDFDFQLIQNMARKEALEVYQNCDIIIDQILTPGGGKLAHEGLAMGKVVLSFMAYGTYDQKKPNDCPIVDVTIINLHEVLKNLIPDFQRREEIAKKGRPYIEKYHNPCVVVSGIIQLLTDKSQCRPDFTPTFFWDKFEPESKEALEVYNKWTVAVKDCGWYKKYVPSGERAGLIF